MESKNSISEKIGKPAALENLAEEAAELVQAALKISRILRNENPCGKSYSDCYDSLTEEFTDVCLMAEDLHIHVNEKLKKYKLNRFKERWERFQDRKSKESNEKKG